MRKYYFIIALLASFLSAHAAVTEEGFEDVTVTDADSYGAGTALSNGWKIVGGKMSTNTNSYDSYQYGLWKTAKTGTRSLCAAYGSSNQAYVVIPTELSGEFRFWTRKTSTSSSTKGYITLYKLTADGGTYAKEPILTETLTSTTWTEHVVDLGDEPVLVGINMIRTAVDDVKFNTYEAVDGPQIAVFNGETKLKGGTLLDAGLVTATPTLTFTLKNPGNAVLNATLSATGDYAVSPSTATVAAGGETSFTVTCPATAYGLKNGTVSIAAESISPVVLNLSALVSDPAKLYYDFSEAPANWALSHEESSWGTPEDWKFESGQAIAGSYTAYMTSPMISAGENEIIYLKFQKNTGSTWSTPLLTVSWSADGTGWTALADMGTECEYGVWKTRIITGIPTTAKYIRIAGKYVSIDELYGCSLPQTAIMQFTAVDYDFGMAVAGAEKTFALRNAGGAPLTGITATASNPAFNVSVPATIEAGGEGMLTVTVTEGHKGLAKAAVTIKADGQADMTFNVSNYGIDTTKMYVNFDSNACPDGWTAVDYPGYTTYKVAFENGQANMGNYYAVALISPQLTVADGEVIAYQCKSSSEYSEGSMTLSYSTDGGTTWKKAKTTSLPAGEGFKTIVVNTIPAGNIVLKWEGKYAILDNINGFILNQNAPVMIVIGQDEGNALAFGSIKTTGVKKAVTVQNTGTGILNVKVSASNNMFTVNPSSLSLAKGESAEVEITVVYDDNYGQKSADITLHPTNAGIADVILKATATTKDADVWEEDFEGGQMPAGWNTDGATVVSHNDSYQAYLGGYNTQYTLTTPRLATKAGEVLTFDAFVGGKITVEYSYDDGKAWAEHESFETETFSGETKQMVFTAPKDGFCNIRISGAYNYVDNFSGFKLALKEHDVTISDVVCPNIIYQYADNAVTATVKELAGKDEQITAKLYIGGEIADEHQAELTANGETTVTFSFVPTMDAESAEAYIVVEYAGFTAESAHRTIAVIAAPVLDEATDNTIEAGTYPAVVVRYTAKAGWNTFALPFQITDLSVFGEGAKAYDFAGYDTNGMQFKTADTFYAGYPYVLYVATPSAETEHIFRNVTILRTTPQYNSYGAAVFQATYAPLYAGQMEGKYGIVPATGCIQIGGEEATLKALRGYFEISSAAGAKEITLYIDGTPTSIDAVRLTENGDETYNIAGQRVNSHYQGIVISKGKKSIKK